VIQKEDCPEAYQPEIVKAQRHQADALKEEALLAQEMERTLFDFDDEIDNLT
jgi:hypothetical protein